MAWQNNNTIQGINKSFVDTIVSNNPEAYGIVYADDISGHRRVASKNDLITIPTAILSKSRTKRNIDAIGQLWWAHDMQSYYMLKTWSNNNLTLSDWTKIMMVIDPDEHPSTQISSTDKLCHFLSADNSWRNFAQFDNDTIYGKLDEPTYANGLDDEKYRVQIDGHPRNIQQEYIVWNSSKTKLTLPAKIIEWWDDKYSRVEIDRKLQRLWENMIWKPSVATFEDIAKKYDSSTENLTPKEGWTVAVQDTNMIYRYDAETSKWINIFTSSFDLVTNWRNGIVSNNLYKALSDLLGINIDSVNAKYNGSGNQTNLNNFDEINYSDGLPVSNIPDDNFKGWTRNRLDNTFNKVFYKLSELKYNIDNLFWKKSVSKFSELSSTYNNSVNSNFILLEGWTASVDDTDSIYRYDGANWKNILENVNDIATRSRNGLMSLEMYEALADLLGIESVVNPKYTTLNPIGGAIYTNTIAYNETITNDTSNDNFKGWTRNRLDIKFKTIDKETAKLWKHLENFDLSKQFKISTSGMPVEDTEKEDTTGVTGKIWNNGITFIGNTDGSWLRHYSKSDTTSYFEIATADNANEPIYVRQYSKISGDRTSSITNEIILMNESGNQKFKAVEATNFTKTGGTSTQILMANGTVNTIINKTTVGDGGWVSNAAQNIQVPSLSFMAYWNGAYKGTSSNLAYCNRGAFGTIITESKDDYAYAKNTFNFGGTQKACTTAEFIEKLKEYGAFKYREWSVKCDWTYANNWVITDTGCGNIQLAGSVIKVYNKISTTTNADGSLTYNANNYFIEIITSPTTATNTEITNGATANAIFIYRNNGSSYSPNWKRLVNSNEIITNDQNYAAGATQHGDALYADALDLYDISSQDFDSYPARNALFEYKGNTYNSYDKSDATGVAVSNGILLQLSNKKNPVAGTNGHWVNQLAWSTSDRINVRQRINTNNWTLWKKLAYLEDNLAHKKTYRTLAQNSGFYKINIKATNAWMLYFRVRVYQSYHYYDIDFSGYNYGNNYWYQPQAKLISSDQDNITVYFGHDSVNNLWIAIPAGQYTGISIVDVVNGYNEINIAEYSNLFEINNIAALNGTTDKTITLSRTATINDNVSTASTLQTARTLTIGNTGKNFNGSENVSWSLSEIGAAASTHYHATLAHKQVLGDIRNTATKPNDYNGIFKSVGMLTKAAAGFTDTLDNSLYQSIIGLRGWNDSSGGNAWELAFSGSNGKIWARNGSTDTWNNWKEIAFADNFIKKNEKSSVTPGNEVYLELWRSSDTEYSSWQIIVPSNTHTDAGNLVFRNNYTNKAVDYFDIFKLIYNTGNAILKGEMQASTFKNSAGTEVSYSNHGHTILSRIDTTATKQAGDTTLTFSTNINKDTNNRAAGNFPATDNSNAVLTINRHAGNYYSQLGFSSNGKLYYRNKVNAVLTNDTSWNEIAFVNGHDHRRILELDADRTQDSTINEPDSFAKGLSVMFRNATGAGKPSGLTDSWWTIFNVNGYSGASSSGAGYRHQFAFSDSAARNQVWYRYGIDKTWNTWVSLAFHEVAGTWTAYQDFTSGAGNSGSDMRFKTNIKGIDKILDKINEISIISYNWNKSGEQKRDTFGVNATQLKNMGGIFAKIVHERDDEEKTQWVEYDRIGVLALKGVQELYRKQKSDMRKLNEIINNQQTEIEELQRENQLLQKKLRKIDLLEKKISELTKKFG